MAGVVTHCVAPMALVTMCARDVPTAPAFLKGSAIIRERLCAPESRHAFGVRKYRSHHQARNAHGAGVAVMALHAYVAAEESGFVPALIEGVEDDALPGIGGRPFQHIAAPYVTNI